LDQFRELLDALKHPEAREILQFLADVGCRPGEACRLEAKHIDWSRGVATLTGKTTKKTGSLRVLYFPVIWITRLKELSLLHPSGALFRAPQGRAWSKELLWHHIRQASQGKNWPWATAYSLRHLFITEGLRRGVPIAHLATLVGHVDTSQIMHTYSHLARHDLELHASLENVIKKKADE
jgi:integrase